MPPTVISACQYLADPPLSPVCKNQYFTYLPPLTRQCHNWRAPSHSGVHSSNEKEIKKTLPAICPWRDSVTQLVNTWKIPKKRRMFMFPCTPGTPWLNGRAWKKTQNPRNKGTMPDPWLHCVASITFLVFTCSDLSFCRKTMPATLVTLSDLPREQVFLSLSTHTCFWRIL